MTQTPEEPERKPQRAVVFIDGANMHQRFRDHDARIDFDAYDLAKVAKKIAVGREVVQVRYYTGKLERTGNVELASMQQRLFERLNRQGVHIRLGRVEQRSKPNELASRIKQLLADPSTERLPATTYRAIHALVTTYRTVEHYVQKAVDTLLVADIARMASLNEYDVAYLFSLDGDMTPGIECATSLGKTVFGAGPPGLNYQVRTASTAFITIDWAWLLDCQIDEPISRRAPQTPFKPRPYNPSRK